ncbi:hypothetical protein ACFYVL_21445 [Streptomyces sp. NPDC004111]|uniref:hypothetical protein n=1 Tax=Streptomyces sp. NPDC004111 TaxID=3364690 RepID=UPI003695E921
MRSAISVLPRRPRHRGLLFTALGLGAGALAALLCLPGNDADTPHPVTTGQAEQMAVSRFELYEKSPLEVVARAPMGDDTVEVRAVIDYRAHRAVGAYSTAAARGLVAWDAGGLAVAKGKAAGGAEAAAAAAKLKPRAWSPRTFGGDPLDLVLRVAMGLGTNRPDNPQLIAQHGAQYLGRGERDGDTYSLYSGPRPTADRRDAVRKGSGAAPGGTPSGAAGASPGGSARPAQARSPLTYWISEQGGLGRVEIRPAGSETQSRIDFGPTVRTAVPHQPWGGRAGRTSGTPQGR